ncbi:putative motility protein [bacterium D16-51]|nr:putative motility protein [bacterium D16-59]RKI62403.1 putative motility protein [bacterium D16-51]
MEILDIAGLSMGMSQAKAVTDVGTAMLAKSLDMVETLGDGMVEMMQRSMMENSVMPNLGGNIDIMV